MTRLADRLRQARERNGKTKAHLAREIGVNASAAVQWESEGGTTPNSANLAKIAKVLNVSYEWLATGRGNALDIGRRDAAVQVATFAQSLFEEQLLELARLLPTRTHAPLVHLLESILMHPRTAARRRKKQ